MRIVLISLSFFLSVIVAAGERKKAPLPFYQKPFLYEEGKITLGGYVDFNFTSADGDRPRFDNHRLIPFIYGFITDYLRFGTEIEFEHGGPDGPGHKKGEVKIEFAALDAEIHEALIIRVGLILSPLSRLNLFHDSPMRDFVARPNSERQIVPTTHTEAGAGLLGQIYPFGEWLIGYSFYVVNGFGNLDSSNKTLTVDKKKNGLRGLRGSLRDDINDNKALIGQLKVSPFLGLDFYFAGYHGAYSKDNASFLSIFSSDVEFRQGPFEILGSFKYAIADPVLGLDQEKHYLRGFYIEPHYHVYTDSLLKGSLFTIIARFDLVERAIGQPFSTGTLSGGVNFRPVEKAEFILEFSYEYEGGDLKKRKRFLRIGMATYF